MINSISDRAALHNGVQIPWFGLGVHRTREGETVENAVLWALEAGYRSIDTATIYGNETGVGRAVKRSGIPRQELFITTKVWNSDQGFESTLAAFDTSLKKLDMDYIDLYLIHWPVKDRFKETWRALEKLYEDRRVRAIGVSNFLAHHLEELLETARIVPMVNQVEFHPYLQQPALQAYCREHQIQMEAWRPIMKGRVWEVPELVELGEKYGKNPVQISLRWMLQKQIVTIPKSEREERIRENAQVFDFEIEPEDMARIDGLDRNVRLGEDPDNFEYELAQKGR